MNARYRIARWLVGYDFILDPIEGDGAFVVIREKGIVMTVRAKTFRLRSGSRFNDSAMADLYHDYGIIKRWGRFVGTVDYR